MATRRKAGSSSAPAMPPPQGPARPAAPDMPAFEVLAAPLRGAQFVEASAGTGKTWTLSAMHLRLLLERGLPISQILVLTFTKAAVAELRMRIRARLVEAREALRSLMSEQPPQETPDPTLLGILAQAKEQTGETHEALLKRVNEALSNFDDAPIRTIDAFCQRSLNESAFAAQLPFSTQVQSDDQALRLVAIKDFWRRQIATPDLPSDTAAALALDQASPDAWDPLLREVLKFPLAKQVWPEAADHEPIRHLRATLQSRFEAARKSWAREADAATKAVMAIADNSGFKEAAIADASARWHAYLQAASPTPGPLHARMKLLASRHLARKKALVPNPFFEAAQAFIDAHDAHQDAVARDVAQLQRQMITLAEAELQKAKNVQRIQTFQDQKVGLLRRLEADVALVRELRQRYPAALIDEFQDTDPVQLGIFRKLYHERHGAAGAQACVFYVGDPKQAIYNFRGADLHSYLQAREETARQATLVQNQRSTPGLLKAVNTIFARNPHAFLEDQLRFRPSTMGEAARSVMVDLRPRRGEADAAALQLWSLPSHAHGRPLARAQAQELALRACADDIAQMLMAAQHHQILIDDRPLRGSDIAVLVTTHQHGTRMRHALARVGVASVELSNRSIFESDEAAELELLMHAVLDPAHHGKLRAAMASNLLGVRGEQLAASVSASTTPSSLVDAGDADQADDAVDPAFKHGALQQLDEMQARLLEWRSDWVRRGIAAMLSGVFEDMAVAERVLPGAQGERRMTNLMHLLELLSQAAQRHPLPQALLRWLAQQRHEPDADDANLLRLDSDSQLVQIVTVHASKGLQYPVVMAPLLWLKPKSQSSGQVRRYHDGHHQVLDFRPPDQDDQDIKARQRDDTVAEGLRSIYVALTRAVHRCTLVIDSQIRMAGAKSDYQSLKTALNWIVGAHGMTAKAWFDGVSQKTAPARAQLIEQAWAAVAREAHPHARLETIRPTGAAGRARLSPARIAAPTWHRARGPHEASWHVRSFSSLLRLHDGADNHAADTHRMASEAAAMIGNAAAVHDEPALASMTEPADAAADHDVRASAGAAAVAANASTPSADLAPDDILRFPRGASSGDLVHAVLERADFTRAETWGPSIGHALDLHPPRLADETHPTMLLNMLRDLADTELLAGLRLRDVGMAQRLNELEFDLPTPSLNLASLQAALASHGLLTPALTHASWRHRGHLRGFIDMVFEHAGRYYLIDWKSNHLGDTPAHYGQAAMNDVMVQHGYHLQHTLYAIALRRHLQRCLGEEGANSAWGGAFVLFVRGVRPDWQDDQGTPSGVVYTRLEPAALDRLAEHLNP